METKEETENIGKLFYFEINPEKNISKDYFSSLKYVNSNKNLIKEFHITKEYSIAITNKNELIQWPKDKILNDSNNTQNNNNNYLSKIPSYIYNKIKFKSISLNSTMCLALDNFSKVMTWGKNSDGLLGLGYDIKSIESPVFIDELKNIEISQISLSENHAVVLSYAGIAYSWGLGKYGELGQERTIYTPYPLQMSTDNLYSKVYCYNFLTCFLDFEGRFSYFGIIIRNFEENDGNMNITLKNLLEDESLNDGKTLIHETTIEEIENEKVIKIVTGNGFVGLLCESGDLYALEYKDKLTKLYMKYFCYDIGIFNNSIFGLAKDEYDEDNYFLCQWSVNYNNKNLLSGDSWDTTFWKIKGDTNKILNYKLINIGISNEDKNSIFILDKNEINNKGNDENKISFEFDSKFDDSYNLRFKRAKNQKTINNKTLDATNNNNQKSIMDKYLNKTYNNSMKINYNFSHHKPNIGIGLNKFKNISNLKSKKKLNKNKENMDNNIYEDLNEYKENEINNYRRELDDIINNFRNRQNIKSNSLLENDHNNFKLLSKNDANVIQKKNQGLYSKNNLYNNNLSIKNNNNNSKDYINNNSMNNRKYISNKKNNNNNQKEIYSNIDDFFGKESSNIIKNDDIFSDLNEFSNTNFNYLNNIDASNKIYGNNSNNLLINSDRTLNFSGNNYVRRNNNRNILARLLNGNDSINLNSIISGKIDKSNDFFSEFGLGKKQGRNTFNETNINRKELIKISKESKIYKTRNLNIDIQESNIESNKNSYKQLSERNNPKENNIIKLKSYFNIDNNNGNKIFYTYNPQIEYELNNKKNSLNINQSFDYFELSNKKNSKEIKNRNRNTNINTRKNDNYLNKNRKNYLTNHSYEESDFNHNEERKTGKFYFSNDEKQKKEKDNNYKIDDEKIIQIKINKSFLLYFCFLVKLYMRKKLFKTCISRINDYRESLDRKYASKMLYRIIKKRIIFYKIKFYRRMKKIRKYYIKYQERLNLLNKRKNLIIK